MRLAALLASAGFLAATSAFAATTLQLDRFAGVKASDGARVLIRHGGAQQVTITEGSTQYSRLEVHGGTLDITGCVRHCPWGYRLTVEIATPEVSAIEAEDGASIEAQGNFPGQGSLAAKASDGGSVNMRAMRAADVNAKAEDGGVVQVSAEHTLSAVAEDGGNVRYWGNPTANIHTDDGGSITQGN